jgi:hypothetical protein
MSNDPAESMALFEAPATGQDVPADYGYGSDPPFVPAARRNQFALAGAVLSFVPLVGLGLSAVGFARSRTRGGVGRTAALVGIALSLLFGGTELYVGLTAPMFDAGCSGANSPVSRLRAIQAGPGGDMAQLANEMNSIHADLAVAAGEAEDGQVRARIQSVADDAKLVGADLTALVVSGDTSRLLGDETKLQLDAAATQSYCDSL